METIRVPGWLADCHLHFEGCLPLRFLQGLARRGGHRFAEAQVFEDARRSLADASTFLSLYAEVCRLFRGPDDYRDAAGAIAEALALDGLRYCEIYVSPEIFSRLGLDAAACLAAIVSGFQEADERGGPRCRLLLDAVRQWKPESAERVLDLYEKTPFPSIVGFGLGGDENSLPPSDFAGAYARARALGLRTSVHAGEWGGTDSLSAALDTLRPDRVDHGIAAAADPLLLRRLAEEETVLWVAPSGNVATGSVASIERHPLSQLLAAGVRVALGADDPLFFATSTRGEYRLAGQRLGLDSEALRKLAANGWRGAFCSEEEREEGLRRLAEESVLPKRG